MNKKKKIGMSVIEMIIAITIFALGVQIFTLVFIKSWNSNSFIIEEGEASLIASRAVNDLVKNVRKTRQADNGDYPIEYAADNDLKIFLDIDNDGVTERVHYFLDGNNFNIGITDPSGSPATYQADDQEIKILASNIINESLSQPVFYFFDESYAGDLEEESLESPVPVEQIRLVRIHFYVNIKADKAPDHINIESIAEFRNLNDYEDF